MTRDEQFSLFYDEYRRDGFSHNPRVDLTEALKNGDSEALEAIDWDEYCLKGIGTMSEDPLTQARFLVVVAGTMGGVYAIEAGIDSDVSLSLADYYIQQCQRYYTVEELTQLTKNTLIHFSKMIERQRKLPKSGMIHRAVEYINRRIFFPIRANEIADALGISLSYLSKRFKEELGMTVKEYIQKEKIREAKNFIQYTDMTMTEIAHRLGFADSSHFTRVFKCYEECTPKEYKNKLIRQKKTGISGQMGAVVAAPFFA